MYYVTYDKETLGISSIKSEEITDIPEGHSTTTISDQDGIDFLTGKKFVHHYFISSIDKHAKLIRRDYSDVSEDLFQITDDLVQDLKFQSKMVNAMNIKYSLNQDGIILQSENILPSKSIIVYVTEFGDPTRLITKFICDLKEIGVKSYTYKFQTTKRVSLWGQVI